MRVDYSIYNSAERLPIAGAWRWLLVLLLAAGFLLPGSQAQPTEHQLKAAVLGNVAKFVEWPAGKNDEALTIGILGHDPFGNDLEIVLKSVKVKGRNIAIKRSEDLKELEQCHIVFFSARETNRARELIQKIRTRPILTVGEDARFMEAGGAISLETEQRKIQISVNLSSADEAGLIINPQLLSLAKTVKRKEQP
jgi:hypothetical protein